MTGCTGASAWSLDSTGRPRARHPLLPVPDDGPDARADPCPLSLCHHYLARRASVRAKVACIRVGQVDPRAAGEAHQLAGITLAHLPAGAVMLVQMLPD